jgi:hypothetical protein
MNGKLFGSILVISSLVLGVGMYYLQNYHWYEEVSMDAGTGVEIQMTPVVGGAPETIIADDFQGIDASSSPLRFRGCFNTPMSIAMLSETYEIEDRAVPLTAPGWFACFNAEDIGESLELGEAIAFVGEREIADGVDRVIAVYPDGRAFVWHQLNEKYAK